MFEAFWQGRLIPGARIDSLPFIEVSLSADTVLCLSLATVLERGQSTKYSI